MTNRILLSSALLFAAFAGNAQDKNATYAITGDGNRDFVWMNIRKIDVGTGQVTGTIFQRSQSPYTLTEIADGKTASVFSTTDQIGMREYPTTSLVAAAAFDNKSQRLFFTPMRHAELRWLDMSGNQESARFFTMKSDALNVGTMNDDANHITRMTIAGDGNVYAITNDGNHLFRITTGKIPTITDLGNLVDADNNSVSVHSKCTSWGGDMVADAFGKLYLISANHHVFEVDIQTRIAAYKGAVAGLPAHYTTNAAAVIDENKIMIASANVFAGYYTITIEDMNAVRMESSDTKFNASDFANGNVLFQKEAEISSTFTVNQNLPPVTAPGQTRIYPNPVTNSNFNVVFNSKESGNYTVMMTDLAGRVLQTNKVSVIKGLQTQNIRINARQARGLFIVNVLDQNKQVIHTEKILVNN